MSFNVYCGKFFLSPVVDGLDVSGDPNADKLMMKNLFVSIAKFGPHISFILFTDEYDPPEPWKYSIALFICFFSSYCGVPNVPYTIYTPLNTSPFSNLKSDR